MQYTYDPTKITDGGPDQMRFELGDTVIDMEGISSPLCDEEYTAIINKYAAKDDPNASWRKAKFKCLEAIMMKFSYEVNTSVDGLSYSLDQRYQRWKDLYDQAKKEQTALSGVPRAGDPGSLMPHHDTPYFYDDMQTNIRKKTGLL